MTTSDISTSAQAGGAPPDGARRSRPLGEAGRLVDWRIGGPRGLQGRYCSKNRKETLARAQVAALRKLAAHLDRARGGSPDTTSAAHEHAGAAFYQVIDERFPRWLASLDQEDPDRAHARWRGLLRSEALEQQEALASAVPDTAFAGRGEGKGRADVGRALLFFRRALNKTVPAPAQQDAPDDPGNDSEDAERTPA